MANELVVNDLEVGVSIDTFDLVIPVKGFKFSFDAIARIFLVVAKNKVFHFNAKDN